MTGKYLKNKIQASGVELAEIAKRLDISPQHLQSKLNAQDIRVQFVKDIARATNKSIYFFLEEEPPAKVAVAEPSENREQNSNSRDQEKLVGALEQTIEAKDQLIRQQKEYIDLLKEQLALLKPQPLQSAG